MIHRKRPNQKQTDTEKETQSKTTGYTNRDRIKNIVIHRKRPN